MIELQVKKDNKTFILAKMPLSTEIVTVEDVSDTYSTSFQYSWVKGKEVWEGFASFPNTITELDA